MGSQLNTSVPNRIPGGKNTTAEKLLVAASELMIERSSIEVSLSDIAQKSGVNAALVKYHFGNKDGLLLALLARDAATEVANLEYLLAQPIAPTAKLRLHIAGIIRAYHQFPYMNRLKPDRRLRPSVFRTACDVARDRRRAGHRRSLPPIHQAHGSADLRRHADDQHGEGGRHRWMTIALLHDLQAYKTYKPRRNAQGKVSIMQLKDVAVLITGGGSGLGAATARAMAAKGAKIAVLDQSKENAEKVAAEVKGVAVVADVTDEEQVKAAIAKAESAHGIARVLMNCAGIGGSQRIVGKDGVYPLAKFVRIINVNLIGTFNVLRLFAERLVTAEPIGEERGVIINTASVAAYEGQIGQIAYSASKGGVVGLTLPAARFLTPLLMGLNEEARKSLGAQVPHPARLGDASEYGNLAVHIVENAMLNGETIRLDGAIRMAPR